MLSNGADDDVVGQDGFGLFFWDGIYVSSPNCCQGVLYQDPALRFGSGKEKKRLGYPFFPKLFLKEYQEVTDGTPHSRDGTPWDFNGIPYNNVFLVRFVFVCVHRRGGCYVFDVFCMARSAWLDCCALFPVAASRAAWACLSVLPCRRTSSGIRGQFVEPQASIRLRQLPVCLLFSTTVPPAL